MEHEPHFCRAFKAFNLGVPSLPRSTIWQVRARFPSKVDEFVLQTQHVNPIIVRQPERGMQDNVLCTTKRFQARNVAFEIPSYNLAWTSRKRPLHQPTGPVAPLFRAPSRRLKCTVRRHKFNKDFMGSIKILSP